MGPLCQALLLNSTGEKRKELLTESSSTLLSRSDGTLGGYKLSGEGGEEVAAVQSVYSSSHISDEWDCTKDAHSGFNTRSNFWSSNFSQPTQQTLTHLLPLRKTTLKRALTD